ncbi:MAG: hypothetical protein MJA84_13355 [Firmicutes bacterium]|nr:hypothetical protein [Bacillota bacterium]
MITAGELHVRKELYISDLEKILRVITNITEYLYKKYGNYNKLGKEVRNMVTTLYNPAIKQEGIKKGIKKGKVEAILELLEEYGQINESLKVSVKTAVPQ